MRKILALLILLLPFFLSACSKPKPIEAEDLIPSLRGYEQAKEIKAISEERKQQAEEVMNGEK
jgi:hypothetical protein